MHRRTHTHTHRTFGRRHAPNAKECARAKSPVGAAIAPNGPGVSSVWILGVCERCVGGVCVCCDEFNLKINPHLANVCACVRAQARARRTYLVRNVSPSLGGRSISTRPPRRANGCVRVCVCLCASVGTLSLCGVFNRAAPQRATITRKLIRI